MAAPGRILRNPVAIPVGKRRAGTPPPVPVRSELSVPVSRISLPKGLKWPPIGGPLYGNNLTQKVCPASPGIWSNSVSQGGVRRMYCAWVTAPNIRLLIFPARPDLQNAKPMRGSAFSCKDVVVQASGRFGLFENSSTIDVETEMISSIWART